MRILFLTQWFEPEPHFKGLVFAKALVARGHEVEVLTGFPNYPGGKLYDGYRLKPYQREVMDGIVVHRVPLYPSHDKNPLRRVANYTSFAFCAAAMGPFLVKRPDVVYAYQPPATIGIAAAALKVCIGVPVVYEIQDMWPDTVAATGMMDNTTALSLLGAYCRGVYRICDRIVAQSPGFERLLIERGVPAYKITVIYNWALESFSRTEANPDVLKLLVSSEKFNVLFAGTMGMAQDLDSVLDAAKLLAQRRPEVQFVFVGGGVDRERLEKRVSDEGIKNVLFLPRQEPSAMGPILDAADVLVVHLNDDPLFRITIPIKTQAYLAAGKPILMGVRGDAADMLTRAGAGITCEPENPTDIAAGVEKLLLLSDKDRATMGDRGREFYDKELSFTVGVARYENVLSQASSGRCRK